MRKSNVIIIVILALASIIFLGLFYYLHFNLFHMLDLWLSIIWWVVIIAICVLIHRAEKKRQEALRTVFVAPNALYNPEAGIVRLQGNDPQEVVNTTRDLLQALEYPVGVKAEDSNAYLRFKYIIRSHKFNNQGDEWEGEVVKVDAAQTAPFSNYQQLARLLSEA